MTYKELELLYSSLLEVQANAGRRIGEVFSQSLPIDMELKISRMVAKFQPIYDAMQKTKEKFALANGWEKTTNGGIQTKPIKKADGTLDGEAMLEYNRIVVEEFDKLAEQSVTEDCSFAQLTEKELADVKAEFPNCPNKQHFLKWCVA